MTDPEIVEALKQHAKGRTQRELNRLVFAAHEEVSRGESREKHRQLPARPRRAPIEWAAYKGHMMDVAGVSHHADLTLDLAWNALVHDDEAEFRFQLDELFRSYSVQMEHVRAKWLNEMQAIVAAASQAIEGGPDVKAIEEGAGPVIPAEGE